jgi:hypothetical protein
MKKQINLRSIKLLSMMALVAVAIVVGANAPVSSQAQPQKFKVGDRVECNVVATYWHKGTVVPFVKNDMYNGYTPDTGYYYRIKEDDSSMDSMVCQTTKMRLLTEANDGDNDADAKADKPAATNKRDDQRTDRRDADSLADREILDCNIKQPPAKNGSAPPPELAKKLIRCVYEKPAKHGEDGAATVDIDEFQIGKPRRWRIREDMGDADANTVVYPVLVSYTWKTFYRTQTKVDELTDVFNCFVNSFNKWQCGLGQRVKESPTKYIPRQ